MGRRILVVLCFCFLVLSSRAGAVGFEPPVPVSPGGLQQAGTVSGPCPTFSWGVVPEARGYRIVVYEMSAEDVLADAVLERQLPGGVSSWTPGVGSGLTPGGRYAWTVGAVASTGEIVWSGPALFDVVGGPSEADFEEALAVVRQYLATRPTDEAAVPMDTVVSGIPGVGPTSLPQADGVSVSGVEIQDDRVSIYASPYDRVDMIRVDAGKDIYGVLHHSWFDGASTYHSENDLFWGTGVGGVLIPRLHTENFWTGGPTSEITSGGDLIPEAYEIPLSSCDEDNRGRLQLMRPSDATDANGVQDSLCYCGLAVGRYSWWCFNP